MFLYHIPEKNRAPVISMLFLVGLVFGFLLYYEFSFKEQSVNIQTASSTEPVLEDGAGTLYEDIEEKDFVTFALGTIEKRCPLYVPDGVGYRECLSLWVQELEKSTLLEAVDEVYNYCSRWSEKYSEAGTLLAGELFLKCVIFKLQG